jgi:basic amino acid/polyamine antiporter, APA family
LSEFRHRGFGPLAATAIVIANMVGTGVFTSLGFQLVDIQSPLVLLLLWVVGGVIALCGALCYAELGAAMPKSGGEYHYVGELFHPSLGFVSGWVSATIGFAAPTALVAMTFGAYLQAVFPTVSPTLAALLLVITTSLAHAWNRRASATVQIIFTSLKVIIIIGFCLAAISLVRDPQSVPLAPTASDGRVLVGSAFAVSLIYVNYAYTGWNAASYIAGEMTNPARYLPWVLALGTLVVLVLYVALNYVFLVVAPIEDMVGKVEIGYIAASHAFGQQGGEIMSLVLAALLISTASAMILAGPRVLKVIGDDFHVLRFLGHVNAHGVPHVAVAALCLMTTLLILSGTFEAVLVFTGFTLSLNTLITVLGVFVLRSRRTADSLPFRIPLYPLPPLLFTALTIWTLVFILIERPIEGLLGLGIVLTGLAMYFVSRRMSHRS